jgi:RNA polymerase sigma-70 factor (ECF subfamily)
VIAERALALELPPEDELAERLAPVLEVLYLLFTEGHNIHEGEGLVRAELCNEAIRLNRQLADHPRTTTPTVHALLSLMLLQASRLSARHDGTGSLLLLHQQDRARWDRELIGEGMRHLERAAEGDCITPYHMQAAIAACHATAPSDEETDWPYILKLYDQLVALTHSPVVELNRAVALARVHGPESGIRELERLHDDPALRRYYLLPAVLAGLWYEAGRPDEAARWYARALALPCNDAERRFLQERAAACTGAPIVPTDS